MLLCFQKHICDNKCFLSTHQWVTGAWYMMMISLQSSLRNVVKPWCNIYLTCPWLLFYAHSAKFPRSMWHLWRCQETIADVCLPRFIKPVKQSSAHLQNINRVTLIKAPSKWQRCTVALVQTFTTNSVTNGVNSVVRTAQKTVICVMKCCISFECLLKEFIDNTIWMELLEYKTEYLKRWYCYDFLTALVLAQRRLEIR